MQNARTAKEHIEELGRRFDVTYCPDAFDKLAEKFSELSDAEATLDGTEQLLVALSRAGHLSPDEAVELHVRYLRELASR